MRRFQLGRTASRSASRAAAGRRGTTLIEVLVVLTILAVSVSIFSGMVVTTARQRAINRESAIAAEAARNVLETMRNTPFREIYPRWNADPADDPEGPGTAPGHRFAVEGLQAVPGAENALIGEVFFPDDLVEVDAGGAGGELEEQSAGGAPVLEWQLREDLPDAELGTPRDLSGDSIIDDEDHDEDYVLLPVLVRLEWDGVVGERSFELHSMLTEFMRADP